MRPRYMTLALALAFLPLTGACAWTPPTDPTDRLVREAAKLPMRGGIAEFRLTSYDGRDLTGRVLLGATVDTLVIEGHMLEDFVVTVEKIHACGTTELREHIIVCRFFSSRIIVTLPRGYWYGSNVDFFLWNKETGLGPDCFDAELAIGTLDGRIAATLPIRVVRTDKPPAPPAGAAEEPKPPPADPGAP